MSQDKHINGFLLSTNKEKLQVDYIHHFLSEECYWTKNIPIEIVKKSIDGSLCFGIYHNEKQIGFARIITDYATFAYLADVFVDLNFRNKGLSKALMGFIKEQDCIKGVRRFMLATLDAHALYQQFGFNALKEPMRFMEIKAFETY
jgi:GNAT superfamily N-acetyltransferase